MTLSEIIKLKFLSLFYRLPFLYARLFAIIKKKSDWDKDSISNDHASKSNDQFHTTFQGSKRKPARTVTF